MTYLQPCRNPACALLRVRHLLLAVVGLLLPLALLAAQPDMGVGYRSVTKAYAELTKKSSAKIDVERGWTIVLEDEGKRQWLFVPTGHAAYPAVIRRDTVMQDGVATLETRLMCQSTKTACDALFEAIEAGEASEVPPPP